MQDINKTILYLRLFPLTNCSYLCHKKQDMSEFLLENFPLNLPQCLNQSVIIKYCCLVNFQL